MRTPMICKRAVDFLLTAALLLLMAYSLIGEAAHEWIGMGMFLLFILHLILNRKWISGLRKGRFSAYRIFQSVLVLLCFLSMVGLMSSGMILSNYIFSFLRIRGWSSFARQTHMICSYWGFVLMSLHLGLHWSITLHMIPQLQTKPCRVFGWLTAIYGSYAFFKRGLPEYLFLRTHFAFFDYEEPVIFFFIDYLAIMGLFIFCAHYGSRIIKNHSGGTV